MKSMSTKKLLLMAGLHFIVMYALMYAMVYSWDHVYLNINKFYMAGIMTAPMLLIEGLLMGSMYANKRALYGIMGVSAVVLVTFFLFIRQQTFVGNAAFLRSMIPHHSSAILMCEDGHFDDAEIADLCDGIVKTQREEIAEMKRIYEEKYK